jgi:hypothetical protein
MTKHHTLQADALTLDSHGRSVIKAIALGDFNLLADAIMKYSTMMKKIKIQLIEFPSPAVFDPKAKEILRKIAVGESFPADRYVKSIEQNFEIEGLTEPDEDEIEDLLQPLFYSWFGPHEYVRDSFEIGSVIVSSSIPDNLKVYLLEAKQCFAFQQYIATCSLCRTILETAVRDICIKRKFIRSNTSPFETYKWSELRDMVSKGALNQQIKSIYKKLSDLMHGHKTSSRQEALTYFRSTLKAIHLLYDNNRL